MKAVMQTPFAFIDLGSLASDTHMLHSKDGLHVPKDDLIDSPKPINAATLSQGPATNPLSLPSLPQVWCANCSTVCCTQTDYTNGRMWNRTPCNLMHKDAAMCSGEWKPL